MESDTKSSNLNPDSSLTESWNVVDSNEIGVSEGSDGESIEVIDDENQQIYSKHIEGEVLMDPADSTQCGEVVPTVLKNQPAAVVDQSEVSPTSSTVFNELLATATAGLNAPFNVPLTLIVFLAMGSAMSILVLRLDELATDTIDLLGRGRLNYNKQRERQDLLNQIQFYKEESQGLRELVADLKAVVNSLKQEVAYQKSSEDAFNNIKKLKSSKSVKSEDSLFQQMLNVHIEDHANYTNEETNVPHQNSFKIINDIFVTLSSDQDRQTNKEIIKVYNQIPKHLSVLTSFETSNPNIKKFIEVWNEKITTANEKLISDIKQSQLKMLRHVIKNLKNTQKNFFEKLCELKDMKKPECHEIFIKPYENNDEIELLSGNEGKTLFPSKTYKFSDKSKNSKKYNKQANTKDKEGDRDFDTLIRQNNIKKPRLKTIKNQKTMNYEDIKFTNKNIEDNFVPGGSQEYSNLENVEQHLSKVSIDDPATDYDKGRSPGREKEKTCNKVKKKDSNHRPPGKKVKTYKEV